jgi:apolipoprotein N-acyltransferase
MLDAFSALSLFPPTLEACDGIPESPATHCGKPARDQRGATPAFLGPTDLIVWPEAPNNFFESDSEFRKSLSRLARTANAPVIAGSIGVTPDRTVERGYDLHNSADFIRPDGSFAGRYDKMHLVPFGEYTPYKKLFFFAGALLQDVGLFDPGKQRTVFRTGGHTYGTFICYESVFGDEVREYADTGADVLVNISDDGWYGDTSAAWEHLNQVRMRAVENHRWILRATNTGVTAVIDPNGRVTSAIPRHIRSSLRAGFNYEHDLTFYAAHGDVFAWLCAGVTLAGLWRSLIAIRRLSN